MSPLGDELFRVAVESAPNAMIMVDQEGRIVLVNAQTEAVFGYPRTELLGQSIDLLVPQRYRGAHPGHRQSFFAHPGTRSMGAGRELYGLRKDGTEVPIEIGLNPIKTDKGMFVLAAVVDITAVKKMQAELLRTQSLAALGEMAATVAHEVKNPLAAISGPLQILADDLPDGDPRKDLMKEILGQIRRLDNTVRGLLTFSRPTTPSKQPIVLSEFIGRIARTAMEQERGRGIRVRHHGPPDLVVRADPALLEQVFWNLFLNSAEAMKAGGEIVVQFRDRGGLEVRVSDNGSGIPPEILQKVFRPFVTTKSSGTGLGLSHCRKIIEAHGGTISITSTPGQGTEVLFRLPL
jgi:PAS domain S-box-containing protein